MNRTEIEEAYRSAPRVEYIKSGSKPRKKRNRRSKLASYSKFIFEYRFSGKSFQFIANMLNSTKGIECNKSTVKRFFDKATSL